MMKVKRARVAIQEREKKGGCDQLRGCVPTCGGGVRA